MNKKIVYAVLAVILLVAVIITAVKGFNVGLVYGEGTEISFSLSNSDVEKDDIRVIAKEVFPNNKVIVQRIEYFTNSALIKVNKTDVSEEDIENLKNKINEKYNSNLTTDVMEVTHVQNIKLRTIIEPYVGPLGLSLLVILGYFAIRFRGTKEMLSLVKYIGICELTVFALYAICRLPVNGVTMPIVTLVFYSTIIIETVLAEFNSKED